MINPYFVSKSSFVLSILFRSFYEISVMFAGTFNLKVINVSSGSQNISNLSLDLTYPSKIFAKATLDLIIQAIKLIKTNLEILSFYLI